MSVLCSVTLLFALTPASGVKGDGVAGRLAAKETWRRLELLVRGTRGVGDIFSRTSGRSDESDGSVWSEMVTRLSVNHPHAEASGALAWLYLFGVPPAFPRDVDRAVAVAREAVVKTGCGRCHALLAFLMGLGYPPLVNVAHLAQIPASAPAGKQQDLPELRFFGTVSTAYPAGSDDAARLPRDIGPRDPAAASYALAAHTGDVLGVLATAHLSRTNLINTSTFHAPGPNQASSVVCRKPLAREGCDPLLTALLGRLAEEAVDASAEDDESLQPWGASPASLAAEKGMKSEADAQEAWLEVVLADPNQSSPDDLAVAAAKIDETGAVAPRGSKLSTSTEMRRAAASRGHSGAALRLAVDHLQRNETKEARPLLQQVAARRDEGRAADAEMASYYLKRHAAEEPDAEGAWQHLERAADLGREDAELLVAHSHASADDAANSSEAIRRYRRITERTAVATAANSSSARSLPRPVGKLSDVQAFAAYNLGVLLLHEGAGNQSATNTSAESNSSRNTSSTSSARHSSSPDQDKTSSAAPGNASAKNASNASTRNESNASAVDRNNSALANETTCVLNSSNSSCLEDASDNLSSPDDEKLALTASPTESDSTGPDCSADAQQSFEDVALSRHPFVRLVLALERRSWQLGDTTGALLLASLLSDLGHPVGHADAAYLWDVWSRDRPQHLGPVRDLENGFGSGSMWPGACNLTGWWTTGSAALGMQNISRVYIAPVTGGGFEMFNASLAAGHAGLQGLSASETISPRPEQSEFRHLHSFLWHTTFDVLPGGAPVPVALQPPGAVPHLVETHHQRGKLLADETCDGLRVEAMWVNWTFSRLGAARAASQVDTCESGSCGSKDGGKREKSAFFAGAGGKGTEEFLHCWSRPEWYFATLEANIAAAPPPAPAPPEGSWESLVALTKSKECPCRGVYGCRRGDGACVPVVLPDGATCPQGSSLCPEIDSLLEPAGKPKFAAQPDVCAFFYHRRAAVGGDLESTHVMSHAYSNGLRGVPRDAKEAFVWSQQAMHAGDKRGLFDVAYSLEFGLGVPAEPQRAYAMYRDLMASQDAETPLAAKASSFLALLSASGRYVAGRLLGRGGGEEDTAPWASSPSSGGQ